MAEVDWAAARARLDELSGKPAEDSHDPTREKALLERRARRLAQPAPVRLEERANLRLLVLRLGGERYGLPAARVLEVLRRRDPAPLPGVPAHVAGVVNYRGEVVAAFDLRPLLGLDAGHAADRLVVLGDERPQLAVLAEEVLEVVALDEATIEPTPVSREEMVRGLAPQGLLVLDDERLLADPRLFVREAR